MRYLREGDAISALTSGHIVEQFLVPREECGYRVLGWVRLNRDADGTYSVARFEVFDEGNPSQLDLYAFSFVDPDQPFVQHTGLAAPEMAIKIAEEHFDADRNKYVKEGVIQDEYADFLRAPSKWLRRQK